MAKKLLKKLKKVAKIAVPVLGALALAKGLKGRKGKVNIGSEDLNIGSTGPQIADIHPGLRSNKYKFATDHIKGNVYKGGGIAKRGMGAAFKKGGHVKSMGIAKRGGGIAKR